ncbi:MAG: tRNA guanosine(34) transglycosylase Tgt [bacterium]
MGEFCARLLVVNKIFLMFKIIKKSKKNKARIGILKTAHGEIETPFFMPDATRAVVKDLSNSDLKALGLPAMVVNTLHLYLQPGLETIRKAKGVNKFMSWDKPLLSDSGGFQVFSLAHKSAGMGKIHEDRVDFKSPLDGAKHSLTPKKSIEIQFDLGTDMMVCFDDCPPNDNSDAVELAVERTIRWARECKNEYDRQIKKRKLSVNKRQLLFGVVQGGENKTLREKCAAELVKIGFDGLGFGARPVDAKGNFLGKILEITADAIPENYIRFGLGIGLPEDIVACARMGWDVFDCVIPTREGRHGKIFSRRSGKKLGTNNFYDTYNISNKKFAKDFSVINKKSKLPELRVCTKAYLHHLFKIKEPLAGRLASLNNLEFYQNLMAEIRKEIG